jgi:hypothetical protein
MTLIQREFDLAKPTPRDPGVDRLVSYLLAAPGWHHANSILTVWGESQDGTNRRWIRALAAAGEPEVISGQRGYQHVKHASAEEVNHFVRWIESQARRMTARAEAVRRRAHALVG